MLTGASSTAGTYFGLRFQGVQFILAETSGSGSVRQLVTLHRVRRQRGLSDAAQLAPPFYPVRAHSHEMLLPVVRVGLPP